MAAAKLVFYSHTGEVSGAEVVLIGILRGLDRERFSPVLLCPEGPLAETARALDVPHVLVPPLQARYTANPFKVVGYVLRSLGTIRRTRTALRAQAPDILHANSVRAGLVASIATRGWRLPVIWHIHDMLPRHPFSTVIRAIANRGRNTFLIAVSQATAEAFRGNANAIGRPITVIYNSVDIDQYKPDPAARVQVRQELGLTDEQVAVGVVGQITPRKRQLQLVEAFSKVRDRMPHAVLLMIGAPQFHTKNQEYAIRLSQRIEELGLGDQVRLAGKRPDMPAVMNALDLLLQNSSNEPLGLALMEGFAACRTAAATGVDGVKEIIEDGVTGLLASSDDDAGDLMRKLELLVNAPAQREEMGRRAREKMVAEFAPSLQMARMHILYEQVLAAVSAAKQEAVR